MDVRSRDGGVAGADGDLVKIRDHIADRVETLNSGLLVRIDFKTADPVVARSQIFAELRAYIATQDGINDIEGLVGSVAHDGDHLPVLLLKGHHMRGGMADTRIRQIPTDFFSSSPAIQSEQRDVFRRKERADHRPAQKTAATPSHQARCRSPPPGRAR
jgi:hypothetical protein